MKIAILDDYQSVALQMADWSAIGPGVSVNPFHERIGRAGVLGARHGVATDEARRRAHRGL